MYDVVFYFLKLPYCRVNFEKELDARSEYCSLNKYVNLSHILDNYNKKIINSTTMYDVRPLKKIKKCKEKGQRKTFA